MISLNELKVNEEAIISFVLADENIKKRLLDVGFVKGSKVKKVLEKGNIVAYEIKGAIMAIRKDDTKNIMVIK